MSDYEGNNIPEDGWREDPTDDLCVLFVEGYCQAAWMQNKLI
jgi:hypothetical protein